MATFKAVLFDMDGLMIDTERLWEEAWHEAAGVLGLGFPKGLYRRTIGLNWEASRKLLGATLGASYPLESLIEAANERYEGLLGTRPLAKSGLFELLDFLSDRGILIGLATSTNRAATERKLNTLGVRDRFEATICGDEVLRGKPDPEPYLSLIETLGLDAAGCLVLEDSYNGVRAGWASGASVIMVPDLLEATGEMREKCMVIVDTLHAVRTILESRVL